MNGHDAEKPKTPAIEKNELAAPSNPIAGTAESSSGKTKSGEEHKPRSEKRLDSPTRKNPRLKALLKERLEILKHRAQRMKEFYEQKAISPELAWQANLRVYKAELDMCDTAKDRIAVLEKIASLYKDKEDRMAKLMRQGTASQDVLFEAKLGRLEAEIALERERADLALPSE